MEKYNRLSKIIDDYLHGHLSKLQINYEDENTLEVSVIYQDQYNYWFDYDMSISIPNKRIEFAKHYSDGYLNKVELNRENDFEKAVCNYIFQN